MIIDHRERELVKELARRKLKYEVKQLLTADIIIKNIVIERKTQQDFMRSDLG